jgi:hypothetical protein
MADAQPNAVLQCAACSICMHTPGVSDVVSLCLKRLRSVVSDRLGSASSYYITLSARAGTVL